MPAGPYQLPMFPLGRAAFPGETVPLRVFEPRYLAMLAEAASRSGEFGVVLIERGSEVGGGDERSRVGSACRVIHDVPFGAGQRAVVAIAERRIRVVDWLEDAPYPRAMVTTAPDRGDVGIELAGLHHRVRKLYALASELGADTAGVDLEDVAPDATGLWRLAALVPLGEFDRQRLLEKDDLAARAELLEVLINDALGDLELRLRGG